MGKLGDWADEKSEFLVINDGETVTATFLSYDFVTSKFNNKTVRYTLDTNNGEKLWESTAGYVARFFDKVKKGQKIRIFRNGEGTDTKYDLQLVDE